MDFYSNLPVNLQQPTLFEILSVNEIRKLIKPTLKYILSTYLQYKPTRWLLKLYNKFDFLILLLKSLIEYRHIQTTGATILDRFYGLKRYSRFHNRFILYLGIWLHDGFIEYLSDVLDQYHEVLQSKKLTQQLNSWQTSFDNLYPKLIKMLKVVNFCFKLKYLHDSKETDLVHFITQIRYERFEEPEHNSLPPIARRKRTNLPRILSLFRDIMEKTSSMFLDRLFPTFLVVIRVLQLINQQPDLFKEEVKVKKPSPPVLKNSDTETGGFCPLCDKVIEQPAMISTGYVACYECIKDWLSSNSTCFVTGNEIDREVRKLLI